MAYQTIANRQVNVAMKLGNRQDLLEPAPGSTFTYSRIAGWLRDAYISVSYSQTFEQTEQTLVFTTVSNQDTYAYPATVRAIKNQRLIGIRQDTGASVICDWKDITYVRQYSVGNNAPNQPYVGTPSIVAAFGQSLIFRPVPDNVPYMFYLDCWMKPIITNDVVSTQLLVPDDWLEVIDYDAAMRGHAELLERDKSKEISVLLYGYVDQSNGARITGITDRLGSRLQAQRPWMDYGIQPKWRPTFGRKG